jgi:hypothetical protein
MQIVTIFSDDIYMGIILHKWAKTVLKKINDNRVTQEFEQEKT